MALGVNDFLDSTVWSGDESCAHAPPDRAPAATVHVHGPEMVASGSDIPAVHGMAGQDMPIMRGGRFGVQEPACSPAPRRIYSAPSYNA